MKSRYGIAVVHVLTAALLCAFPPGTSRAEEAANDSTKTPRPGGAETTLVKSHDVELRYMPKPLSRRGKAANRDRNLLQRFAAGFECKQALVRRRTRLPAGKYRVAVEGGRDEPPTLIFIPVKKDPEKEKSRGASTKKAAATTTKAKEAQELQEDNGVRFPMRLRPGARASEQLEVALKPFDRSRKLRFLVRAGATEAFVNFRYTKPPPAPRKSDRK